MEPLGNNPDKFHKILELQMNYIIEVVNVLDYDTYYEFITRLHFKRFLTNNNNNNNNIIINSSKLDPNQKLEWLVNKI